VKHRPLGITALAFLLTLAGPVIGAYWLSEHWIGPWETWANLNPIVSGLCIFCMCIGYGIWKVRMWAYYGFLLLSAGVLSYLVWDFVHTTNESYYINLMVCATFAISCALFLNHHISAPYFNPRLRWWERDLRYRVNLGVKFQIDRQTRKGQLLDISRSGCFAEIESPLIVGEEVEMKLSLQKFEFTTKAMVIWSCDDPKGYGLMFIGMTRRQKKEVDAILEYLISSSDRPPEINQGINQAS